MSTALDAAVYIAALQADEIFADCAEHLDEPQQTSLWVA
jgi:hypothetical protein